MSSKFELLAPAGSLERLKWAILYGADAVYLGGANYSLRANAKNFNLDEIKEGVLYAHKHHAKVYVAVNIVFHDEDVIGLKNYLKCLEKMNVDAIIVSDPLVIDMVRDEHLKLKVHLSTQACVLNKDAALYYEKCGVSRIVLARECSSNDIKDIINNTNIEIECFIHGAMCTNLSGRCVLSNYFTNRDANRGGCCQACRFNYNFYDNKEKLISKDANFTIAPKDLSLAKYLKDMMNMGVSSFKLEGRMRSVYYVATIVSVYRKLIDMYEHNRVDNAYISKATKILYRCANRDVTPQFFDKKPGEDEQYYSERQEDSNQDFLAVVLDYDKKRKEALIEERNYFEKGCNVNIFTPNGDDFSFCVSSIKDKDDNMLDKACHPKEILKINCPFKVPKNSIIRVNFLD